MSHFTVTVCLPGDCDIENVSEHLSDVLARWDESRRVEPYRDYEEGPAAEFWWVQAMRAGALSHRELQLKGAEELARERLGKRMSADTIESHNWMRATRKVEELAAKWADDARWAVLLGVDPVSDGRVEVTWETVVRLYNQCYHPAGTLAVAGEVDAGELDQERLHYDEEMGRAYTWSVGNPEGKWDWYVVGGRWRNSLHAKPGVDASCLILSNPHYTEEYRKPGNEVPTWAANRGRRCDGGPKGLLDLESMRAEAEARAHGEYDQWEKISAFTPHAQPWSHFHGLAQLGELSFDEARERYRSQPRVSRALKHEELRWLDDVVDHFGVDRAEYVAAARRDAVPGYALVTLDRRWLAPGEMGWFGLSSDGPGEREAYKIEANRYLDELADDVLIVQVDCHT